MATVDTAKLQEMAMKHLWLHFTQMAGFDPDKHPVMVRGENIFLHDSNGNRYMDFLSGLFTVQIGYSYGEEIGQAMLEQAMELPYYTNWTYCIRARSSWPPSWRSSRPTASTARSSSLVGLRGLRAQSSWLAITTTPTASQCAAR